MRKKLLGLLLSVTMIASMLAGCGGSNANKEDTAASSSSNSSNKTVNMISWAGMEESNRQKLEEISGYKINYTPFSSLEELYTKLASGGAQYDMAVSGDYMIATMISQNMLQPIDTSKLSNYSKVSKSFLNPSYDPDNKYSVPSSGGHVGILVNRDKVKTKISSYKDLFTPDLKNQIVILDDQRILMGIAGLLLGNDFNEKDETKLKAQVNKLQELVPNIKAFQSSSQRTLMLNGEANIMIGWSSDAYRASLELKNWEYIYPSEGMHMYVDCAVIPKGSKNVEGALKVADAMISNEYLEVASKTTPGSKYANGDFVSKQPDNVKNSPIIYPPQEQYPKARYLTSLDGKTMTTYDTLWTEFKQKAAK